jgi:hypothetical protein
MVFYIGFFCAFCQQNHSAPIAVLRLRRSLNFGLVHTDSRQKHAAEPVQFAAHQRSSVLSNQCFGLPYWLNTLPGTICEVQSFTPNRSRPVKVFAVAQKVFAVAQS